MSPFGRSGRLLPHELAVLGALAEQSSPRVLELLHAQLGQIRYVQRLRNQPEVNFYARHRKGGGWEEETLFPLRSEFELGRVRFRLGGEMRESTVYAVNGHVFALVTRPPVGSRSRGLVEVEQVVLGPADPLSAGQEVDASARSLPDSYLRYVSGGKAREVNGWSVLELVEAYGVAGDDADLAVLAAGAGGRLLVGRVGEAEERYFIVDPGEPASTLEADSFDTALWEVAGGDSVV